MFFRKKLKESDCCRYCKSFEKTEDAVGKCRRKGEVKESFVCKRYEFNPFAPRTPRLRNLDTTMFDPLDFKL